MYIFFLDQIVFKIWTEQYSRQLCKKPIGQFKVNKLFSELFYDGPF